VDSIEILTRVIAMLEPLLKKLDTSYTECGECKQKHYTNWKEKKAFDAIQAAITKAEMAKKNLEEGR